MIVYGDSYTLGENNGFVSFADYLRIEKHGISGTCLDDYSIYPVKDGLISQISDCTGEVLIEYGVNDAASLATGYVSKETIKVAIAKVRDLTKDAYFLALTKNTDDLMYFSAQYAKYLTYDYLKGLFKISAIEFYDSYQWLCEVMGRTFKTFYMLPEGFKEYDTDGIHPTDKGYRLIADNLKQQMERLPIKR